MREDHRQAICPEVTPPEPRLACRPPSLAYLSNNKNLEVTLLISVCSIFAIFLNPSPLTDGSATLKD
jgi:hypothetical protein